MLDACTVQVGRRRVGLFDQRCYGLSRGKLWVERCLGGATGAYALQLPGTRSTTSLAIMRWVVNLPPTIEIKPDEEVVI